MPTDRLARFRNWPSGVYTDELAQLWRADHPLRTPELAVALDAPPASPRRIAVICHVFYTDLLDEVETVLKNVAAAAESVDLFISVVSEEDRAIVVARLAEWESGRTEVRIVPNRGRDIAPKYVAFADVYERGFDLVLFLHTKKSTPAEIGTPWRRYLFESLAGSPKRVNGILALFERDPQLGVLAPTHFDAVVENTLWHGSFLYAARLARRMGIRVRRWSPPDFASGSMFWTRPQALSSITGLRLRIDEFPLEARQVTATNMHALERLVFAAAAHAGYAVAMAQHDGVPVASTLPQPEAEPKDGPGLSTRSRALPPTIRRMAADLEVRRKKFSPCRVLPIFVRRLRRL